jgi:hypothetical protein
MKENMDIVAIDGSNADGGENFSITSQDVDS